MAHRVDPKVFFSNERTYLKWLHTSVTVGSIASALLGFSSYDNDNGGDGGGMNPIRAVGLIMLIVAILFCCHAISSFYKRARLLERKAGDGYESSSPAIALAGVLVVALTAIYVYFLVNRTAVHI